MTLPAILSGPQILPAAAAGPCDLPGVGAVCNGVDDVVNGVTGAAGDIASSASSNVLENFAESITEAVGNALAGLGTLWVNIRTVPIDSGGTPAQSSAPPGSGDLEKILSWAMYVSLAVCIASLMVVAVRIAWPRRHADLADDAGRVGGVLIAVMLISGGSALISGLLASHRIDAGGAAGFVQARTWWYVLALAVLSVVIAGGRMAWEQRAQPAKELAQSLLTLVLVAGAGIAVIAFLTRAGDEFSEWIIADSLRCGDDTTACFGDRVGTMLGLTGATAPALGVIMTIVLGLIALITSLVQIMLMIARSAMLVLLAGVLPLTAAATNTEWGRQWFKKAVAWVVAFLLYKPVVAIIYATAFQLVGDKDALITGSGDTSGLVRALGGMMLMLLSVIALPALMRFVTPAVGSMGAGSSAGLAAAGAMVPAMGAVTAVGRFSGGEGSGSGGGAPAPTSASGAGGGTGGGTGAGGGGSTSGSPVPAAASAGGTSGATSAAGTGAAAATGGATMGASLVAEGAQRTAAAAQGAVGALAEQADAGNDVGGGQA